MSRTIAAACLALALSVAPAIAVEPLSSRLEITYQYGGKQQVRLDGKVPLLPDNVCYTWFIQLPADVSPKEAVEALILPEPLADWGDLGTNANDGTEISGDGRTATSTFVPELDADGWFSKGWCAAKGDPLGQHRIDVSVDGASTESFVFEVVAPEDYPWPSIDQPDPRERSVVDSW